MFYKDEYPGLGYDYISGEYVYGDDLYVPDDYMDERWWYIDGVPGYMISDCGRVWSSKSQKFLKVKPLDKHGHLGVSMSINGKHVYRYIHQLMARAFIPNPNRMPVVRHLDDNPKNNYLDNFAWGTQKDNYEDCRRNGHVHYVTPEEREIGLEKMRIPVLATDLKTGRQTRYASQTEAARDLGLQQANVWKVLNGHRKHTCGYHFEYLNKEIDFDDY